MRKMLWFLSGFALAGVIIAALYVGPLMVSKAGAYLEAWRGSPPAQSVPLGTPTSPPTTPTPTPTPSEELLHWVAQGPTANRCAELTITNRQEVYYRPCQQGPRLAYMTAQELATLVNYLRHYTSFEYAVREGQGIYGAGLVRLRFAGQGAQEPSPEIQAEIAAWASGLYQRLWEAEQQADLVAQARLDLAARRHVNIDEIQLLSLKQVTWPDACLGLRQEGVFCAQVLTPGYQLMLGIGDDVVEYRADSAGRFQLVEIDDRHFILPPETGR